MAAAERVLQYQMIGVGHLGDFVLARHESGAQQGLSFLVSASAFEGISRNKLLGAAVRAGPGESFTSRSGTAVTPVTDIVTSVRSCDPDTARLLRHK